MSLPEKAFPVSWDQFHRDARALAWRLAGTNKGQWKAIVCITRGGLVPAAIISRELGIRIIETVCVASYHDYTSQGQLQVLKEVTPERRFYPANRQTTAQVAIQLHGTSDLYVVLGERRDGPAGPVWLVRAFWNPWARLIFLGPLLMALGGLVSLSDRRLRIAAGARAAPAKPVPAAALGAAE